MSFIKENEREWTYNGTRGLTLVLETVEGAHQDTKEALITLSIDGCSCAWPFWGLWTR